MKLTNQEIQQHIAELPDNVRKAVITFNWGNEILTIAQEHKLHMDQIEAFRYETLMVILGLNESNDYVSSLSREMGIKKNSAEELVIAANIKIFRELQKRAFEKEPKEIIEELSPYDDYLEPIGHHDLRGPMSEEGVHLIDESSRPQTVLQNEIDEISLYQYDSEFISSDPMIDHRSLNSFEMNSHDRVHSIKDNNNSHAENTLVFKDQFNQDIASTEYSRTSIPKINSYNEPIDAKDLQGIKGSGIDTTILTTQNQMHPEAAFTQINESQEISLERDKSHGLEISLDKHLMNNPFIAKGDVIDISPTEQDQIKENGTFLQSLKKES